jgi:O-antigen ligase
VSLLQIRSAPSFGATLDDRKSRSVAREGGAVEQALFWVFLAGLAWCPFYYGSNVVMAWGINAVLFPSLVVFYEASLVMRGQRHPVAVSKILASAMLFIAVVVWIVIQSATWTPRLLHHPIWAMAAETLGRPVKGSISVNRDLTSLGLLRLLTTASVFWLAMQLCRNSSRARFLITALMCMVSGYAAYGLVAFAFASAPVGWWFEGTPVRGFVTSTFVNRAHFAAYAGIGLVTSCASILRLYRRNMAGIGGSFAFRAATAIEVTQRGLPFIAMAFLILVSILLAGSRGGMLAVTSGLLALGSLSLAQMCAHGRSGMTIQTALLVTLALLVTVVATLFAFGDTILGKLAEGGVTDSARLAVYLITLRSIVDSPMLGYGYGTFVDTFPMFRDRSIGMEGVWEQAHNTYLETIQGLGLVFGAMLLTSVIVLVGKCLKAAIVQENGVGAAPAVAVSVACLVGVHSLVDFSLQIQAIALTFAAVLGAGVAQVDSSRILLGEVAKAAKSFGLHE